MMLVRLCFKPPPSNTYRSVWSKRTCESNKYMMSPITSVARRWMSCDIHISFFTDVHHLRLRWTVWNYMGSPPRVIVDMHRKIFCGRKRVSSCTILFPTHAPGGHELVGHSKTSSTSRFESRTVVDTELGSS